MCSATAGLEVRQNGQCRVALSLGALVPARQQVSEQQDVEHGGRSPLVRGRPVAETSAVGMGVVSERARDKGLCTTEFGCINGNYCELCSGCDA